MKLITKPLGCIFSILLTVFLIALLLAVIGLWAAGKWGPGIAADTIESRTGFPTHIGTHHVNLFAGVIDLRDITISNPASFPDTRFFNANELSVHASPVRRSSIGW